MAQLLNNIILWIVFYYEYNYLDNILLRKPIFGNDKNKILSLFFFG